MLLAEQLQSLMEINDQAVSGKAEQARREMLAFHAQAREKSISALGIDVDETIEEAWGRPPSK